MKTKLFQTVRGNAFSSNLDKYISGLTCLKAVLIEFDPFDTRVDAQE